MDVHYCNEKAGEWLSSISRKLKKTQFVGGSNEDSQKMLFEVYF